MTIEGNAILVLHLFGMYRLVIPVQMLESIANTLHKKYCSGDQQTALRE